MKVAIYGRNFQDSFIPYIQELFNTIKLYDWGYCIYEPYSSFLKERLVLDESPELYNSHEDIAGKSRPAN